jgi:L-fucose isomerase-like protein
MFASNADDSLTRMNKDKDKSTRVGVISLGRRRPGFDVEWGKQMEERIRSMLPKTPFTIVEPSEKAVDEASFRRCLGHCEAQKADVIVLLQTTMGDGRLAPTLAQHWPDPLILWATPEKPDGDMISSCSLVGAHCWASVLRQMGHSFELVYGDAESAETQRRFIEAVRISATIRSLRMARIGVIGGQAPGYFAMSADPFSVHRSIGAQVQTFSLIEFANVVEGLSSEAVAEDVAKVKALGLPHKDTTDDDLPMASRLYLALRAFLENERLDALTIRDWPEMPNTFGQWPYLAVARLVEEGQAVGIEGDVDGSLSAWIAESLGLGRCYLSDWLEHDGESITLWHGGAAPMSLCEPVGSPGGPRIARHFNITKPAVIEATLRTGMPVTVFRFWRLDGRYLLSAREGESIKPGRHLMATNARARMSVDPGEWFEELCHAGMPHHVVVVQGHHAALFKRLARVMSLQFL